MCSNHSSPFCCFPLVHKFRTLYPLNLARIQQWRLLTEGELSILGLRGRRVQRELRWFTTYREMGAWSTLTSWRSLSPHHQDSISEVCVRGANEHSCLWYLVPELWCALLLQMSSTVSMSSEGEPWLVCTPGRPKGKS